MNRRGFVALVVTGLLPRPAAAQQPSVWRIGWLSGDRAENSPFFDAFRGGMRDAGYIEGRNLVIEARFADGSGERLDQLAVDLVSLKPHVIVTQGGPATHPVIVAGATMPVVFGYSGDPVEGKVVNSLARPGGNFTGVSFLSLELVGKRMELLKEALPTLKRVAIVARPEHPGEQGELRASQAAAKRLGMVIDYFPARSEPELEDSFAGILKSGDQAVVVFPDAFTMRYSEKFAAFAQRSRIPAVSGWAQFAERGNLMTYGPNLRDSYRRLATYVDRIIRGARPADLPVELPTSVEFIVNLKAARALGIVISRELLYRADRVIE